MPSSPTLDAAALTGLIGRRVAIAGHFQDPVTLDGVEDLGNDVQVRIRAADGTLHETVLDLEELERGAVEPADEGVRLVPGDDLFDLVEAQRIEHAYAHDPNFAVSMSGVRGLPHQIVAVYRHMLPQPRLRFVLADDPGAGLAHGPLRPADVSGKKVHLRDFAERGGEAEVGADGARLIDVLHGVLWRASHAAGDIPTYLDATRPDAERLRQVAQALQGRALRDEGETKAPEAQACERLLGAWGRLVEDNLLRARP